MSLLINREGYIHYCEKCFKLYANECNMFKRQINWKVVTPKVMGPKCSCCYKNVKVTSQWDIGSINIQKLEEMIEENSGPIKMSKPISLEELSI